MNGIGLNASANLIHCIQKVALKIKNYIKCTVSVHTMDWKISIFESLKSIYSLRTSLKSTKMINLIIFLFLHLLVGWILLGNPSDWWGVMGYVRSTNLPNTPHFMTNIIIIIFIWMIIMTNHWPFWNKGVASDLRYILGKTNISRELVHVR